MYALGLKLVSCPSQLSRIGSSTMQCLAAAAKQGADVRSLSVEVMSPSSVLRRCHVPADEREEVQVALCCL